MIYKLSAIDKKRQKANNFTKLRKTAGISQEI